MAGKGTFKESWTLRWTPELMLRVVDAARFGNTVAEAASTQAQEQLEGETELGALAALTERVLVANLPEHLDLAARRLDAAAAHAKDLSGLADAIPQLARWARYGEVRGTRQDRFEQLLDSFLARFRAGVVSAGLGLGAELDAALANRVEAVDRAVRLLGGERAELWTQALVELARHSGVAPSTRGRAVRKLLDADPFSVGDAAAALAASLARGTDPVMAVRWLEGFLAGSALLLLHDEVLLGLLDEWLVGLNRQAFEDVLPLLRRNFSALAPAERHRLGARLRAGDAEPHSSDELDEDRARLGVEVAARLLGLGSTEGTRHE